MSAPTPGGGASPATVRDGNAGHDLPDIDRVALEKAATGYDNRWHAAALGLVVVAASGYPIAFDAVLAHIGVRAPASALAAAALTTALRATSAARVFAAAFVAGLCGAAAVAADAAPLRLLPAFVHAGVAVAFFASLRGGSSLVEQGARLIQPMAPVFIGPYCRRVTAVWGVVMLVNAGVLAWTALLASPQAWKTAAGTGIWSWMAAVSLVEFLVRKTYFRNYWYGGPFERLWSRLFPSEATEMGRRSEAWIRAVRAGLEERKRGQGRGWDRLLRER